MRGRESGSIPGFKVNPTGQGRGELPVLEGPGKVPASPNSQRPVPRRLPADPRGRRAGRAHGGRSAGPVLAGVKRGWKPLGTIQPHQTFWRPSPGPDLSFDVRHERIRGSGGLQGPRTRSALTRIRCRLFFCSRTGRLTMLPAWSQTVPDGPDFLETFPRSGPIV